MNATTFTQMNKISSSKIPRLLLILTEFPPRFGGMQTHALYLSTFLAEQGFELEVITYQPASNEERVATQKLDRQFPFKIRRVLSRLGFFHNVEKLEKIARTFNPDLIYSSTVFYGLLKDTLNVPMVCRSVGNDILRPWIAYPFTLGSRFLSTPTIDEQMYRFFRGIDYPELVEVLFRKERFNLMRQSALKIDRILANSRYTAGLLQDIGVEDKNIEIVVGGVDAKRFRRPKHLSQPVMRRGLGFNQDDYLIMTACRLVAKKGIDFLIHSMKELREKIPNAHLIIVGEGRHSKRYRRFVRKQNLGRCISFAGVVDHQTIHQYYWASDLFILASRVQVDPRTGLKDAETMGRVLLEANAAGTPVVAANSGGIPSVIRDGENGLLFTSDDQRSMFDAVSHIQSKSVQNKLIKNGIRYANDRFDWSVILSSHLRSFGEVLGDPNLLKSAESSELNFTQPRSTSSFALGA